MGQVPYSDTLNKAGMCIRVWSLVIRHKERNSVNTRRIRRLAKRCKLKHVLKTPLEKTRSNLDKAWKQYKIYKKEAYNLRCESLCEREDAAKTDKEKKEIKKIRIHE